MQQFSPNFVHVILQHEAYLSRVLSLEQVDSEYIFLVSGDKIVEMAYQYFQKLCFY